MDTNIEKYLVILAREHPQSVLNLIVEIFAKRAYAERKNVPQFDKSEVESYFFRSLHSIRDRLISNKEDLRHMVLSGDLERPSTSYETLEKLRWDLIAQLSELPIFDAVDFLAELIISWGMLIPNKRVDELLLLSPLDSGLENKTPENVSEVLINWFGRYFDLWN